MNSLYTQSMLEGFACNQCCTRAIMQVRFIWSWPLIIPGQLAILTDKW